MGDIYLRHIGKKLRDEAERTELNAGIHGWIKITDLVTKYDENSYKVEFYPFMDRRNASYALISSDDIDAFMDDDMVALERIMSQIRQLQEELAADGG